MTRETHGDPSSFPAEERDVAAWLEKKQPTPTSAFRERGRRVVDRAIRDRATRRHAAAFALTGWLALALAAAVAFAR